MHLTLYMPNSLFSTMLAIINVTGYENSHSLHNILFIEKVSGAKWLAWVIRP